jgi:hypothetical protein
MRADDRAIDDKFRMPLFVVFERPMVCALSALGLGRSVVICVNDSALGIFKGRFKFTFSLSAQKHCMLEG